MRPAIDMIGRRCGRLKVVGISHAARGGQKWLCVCDCGNEAVAFGHHLRQGLTISCGCARGTHRQSRTQFYAVWQAMRARCHDERDPGFANYGGRGIAVCDRWRSSFEAFRDDLGPKPSPSHSIDRIDNDGNYEPGNVRWATKSEQASNTRLTRRITARGESLTYNEWAARTGLSRNCIRHRHELVWAPEDIVSIPSQRRRSNAVSV